VGTQKGRMGDSQLKCPKCGSNNISVQVVSITKNKGHSVWYWLFIGWWLEMLLWIFLTIPRLLIALFTHGKTKSVVESYAVCQSCGCKWQINN
jgi:predicted RNA-binding Zn-ribbon protein involved in translation (DUF1610 family)